MHNSLCYTLRVCNDTYFNESMANILVTVFGKSYTRARHTLALVNNSCMYQLQVGIGIESSHGCFAVACF